MSFDEGELTFYDVLNNSQWSDTDSTEDDSEERYMYHSDRDIYDDIEDTYSLTESIELPEDSFFYEAQSDDRFTNFVLTFLEEEKKNSQPELKEYSVLKNGNCIKLELIERNSFGKLRNMTNSNQLRAPRTVFQGDILTYFITQTNKNHFLINQTYSPLLYAVSINSFDLVRDLIVNLKCDTNVTHSCHLNFEKYNHLNLFMTNAYQTCTSKEELLKERIAIEACDFNSTEIHFYSPLMLAVKNNNYQMCELLLNYNADVSCLYANGKKSCGLPSASSLSLAISSNNYGFSAHLTLTCLPICQQRKKCVNMKIQIAYLKLLLIFMII